MNSSGSFYKKIFAIALIVATQGFLKEMADFGYFLAQLDMLQLTTRAQIFCGNAGANIYHFKNKNLSELKISSSDGQLLFQLVLSIFII